MYLISILLVRVHTRHTRKLITVNLASDITKNPRGRNVPIFLYKAKINRGGATCVSYALNNVSSSAQIYKIMLSNYLNIIHINNVFMNKRRNNTLQGYNF